MKILSIAVPAYNVERYLEKTLLSFINPNILEYLEILIINDGSSDRTQEIAQLFVDKYPGTFKLVNKENGGHGSTINVSIRMATGKYFKIVDGDDWVDTQSLVQLVSKLKETECDLCLTNYRTVNMHTGETVDYRFDSVQYDKYLSVDDILKLNVMFPMATVCYNTSLLKEHNISLQEKTFYVDEEYNVFPFAYVEKIIFFDIIVYNYLIGNVNQSISIKNQIARIDHKIRVAKRLIEYVTKQNIKSTNLQYCNRKIIGIITSIYLIMMVYNSDRGSGRKIAADFCSYVYATNKYLFRHTCVKYWIFYILNRLGIGEKEYEIMTRTLKRIVRR